MIDPAGMADRMHFRIRKGLDLPMAGAPDDRIEPAAPSGTVALVGADYPGLEPQVLIEEGDRVPAGAAIIRHKRDPLAILTAPGSGTVVAIHRGARRMLKSVVIELDASDTGGRIEYPGRLDDARQALLESGLWAAFRTRPFGRIPHSASSPRAIFVTAMDTRPLSGNPHLPIADEAEVFHAGLEVLRDLCDAPVFLCTGPEWPIGQVEGVTHATFEGPHPAGLPGTHIHHLAPVDADRQVWHLGWQDTLAIGRLFRDRALSFERVVALGGATFARPRLLRTRLGADLEALTAGEWRVPESAARTRLLSGSPLCGRRATGSERWLGRYHDQISGLAPPPAGRRLRWRRLFDGRFSFAGTFDRASGTGRTIEFTAEQNGRATALVPIDAFEKMVPMDILTEPLLRALLIGDTDQAQALGCLELVEEDMALCSFICPGKNDYGAVLRINLNRIEAEG
jgi:Na+-transporting NADH:ubiquinone oxidoreductase subunit A